MIGGDEKARSFTARSLSGPVDVPADLNKLCKMVPGISFAGCGFLYPYYFGKNNYIYINLIITLDFVLTA